MGDIQLVVTVVVVVMVCLLFTGLVIGAYKVYGKQRAASDARRTALAQRMTAQGFHYRAQVPERTTLFAGEPFGLGVTLRRFALDVVSGEVAGRPFETFAYQYDDHHSNHNNASSLVTYPYQITWIELPTALPTMRLTADDALTRVATKLSGGDLLIESHEFNERWKVWCEDERVGHAILTPALIAYLLAPGWVGRAVVIEGNKLMTYTAGHADLHQLEGVVGSLYAIHDQIPAAVLGGSY